MSLMTGLRFARGATRESSQTSAKRGGVIWTAAKRLSSTSFTLYKRRSGEVLPDGPRSDHPQRRNYRVGAHHLKDSGIKNDEPRLRQPKYCSARGTAEPPQRTVRDRSGRQRLLRTLTCKHFQIQLYPANPIHEIGSSPHRASFARQKIPVLRPQNAASSRSEIVTAPRSAPDQFFLPASSLV
jgi:hypothetical protein